MDTIDVGGGIVEDPVDRVVHYLAPILILAQYAMVGYIFYLYFQAYSPSITRVLDQLAGPKDTENYVYEGVIHE